MGLLDQLVGAVLAGQGGQSQGQGGAGGLGELLSGLAGGGRQSGGGGGSLLTTLLPVVLAMLQRRGGGAGGGLGGLGGLLQQFQAAGLSQQADSWVSTGANLPISAEDLTRALGRDQVAQIAAQAGVSEEQASSGLAAMLPELVNQLTPNGAMPEQNEMDDALGSLQHSLGI